MSLIAGVRAGDEILSGFFGSPVTKADPLTRPGFDSFVLNMLDDLQEIADPVEQAGMKAMVSTLQRQWGGLSAQEQKKAIDSAAKEYLGITRELGTKVGPVLKDHAEAVSLATKMSNATRFKLNIEPNLDIADHDAVTFATYSTGNYIRNAQGVHVARYSKIARDIVAKGVEDGLDYHAIGAQLSETLNATSAARSDAYWKMIASTFIARSRTYSTLRSFDEAGITAYQFESVLDERTSHVCRFMHGRVFPVAKALGKFAAASNLDDPLDLPDVMPWPGVGKTDEGDLAIFVKQGGSRKFLAQITESGMGQKDNPGKYAHAASNESIADIGCSQPPLHGHCRSTLIPVFGAGATPNDEPSAAPPPEAPQPKAPPPPPLAPAKPEPPANLPENLAELVRPIPIGDYETPGDFSLATITSQQAKAKLDSLPTLEWSNDYAIAPVQPKPDDLKLPKLSGVHVNNALKAEPHEVPIANIVHGVSGKPTVAKAAVVDIMNGTDIPVGSPVVVKFQGQYHLFTSKAKNVMDAHDALSLATSNWANGADTMTAHVIDGDAIAAKPPKPKKPKIVAVVAPPPAPVVPPAPPPIPALNLNASPTTILHQNIGAARGSNEGGMYEGSDGVKRYVKFYPDASQAQCEHLANRIYQDLGVHAPDSQTFKNPKGGTAYASVIFDGGKTLQQAGLTEERAKKFMKGFVGDILTGNWDAVGTGLDNAMVLPSGEVVRIDNGGTFLFRAKQGRKSASVLNEITEWDKFFDAGVNPYYAQVAKAAGYSSAEELGAELVSQFNAVKRVRNEAGSWADYVEKVAGDMSAKDKAQVIAMLEVRTSRLEERIADILKPKPVANDLLQFSTVTPRAGLAASDLPAHAFLRDTKTAADKSIAKGLVPDTGERMSEFRERTGRALQAAPAAARSSITAFTGSSYSEVRDSEMKGQPNYHAKNILKAYDAVPGEERTVYRGIHLNSYSADKVLKMHLENEVWGLGHEGKGATSSTSWDINRAFSFGGVSVDHNGNASSQYGISVIYKLKNKSGIAVEHISSFEHEYEVLVSRTARFRTTGLSWAKGSNNKVLIVEAEEVGTD